MRAHRHNVIASIAIFLLVLLVFARCLRFDFVNLDDPSNLQKNPAMQHVLLAWDKPYLDAYLPVTYTLWRAVKAIASPNPATNTQFENWTPIPELNPAPFHLLNIVLHAASAVLLFYILRTLFPGLALVTASLLALLFAAHPIQVEAVAWVTALKDVLSGFLSLLVIWLFIQKPLSDYRGRRDTARLFAIMIIFLAACLAKSTRVFLPLWLLGCGALLWKQTSSRLIADLLPLFISAALLTLFAMVIQPHPKDMAYQEFWRRPLVASDALLFYFYKLFWPAQLALDYGRNPRFLFETGVVYQTCLVLPVCGLLIWGLRDKLDRWFMLGLAGFVMTLLPVLGLTPFMFQTISTVSDRYCYLSLALLLIGVTPLLMRCPQRVIQVGLTLLILICIWRSQLQLPAWRNSVALWRHTIKVTADSGIAHNNLAAIYEQLGQTAAAIDHYTQSMSRLPRAETCSRIAILYTDLGDWHSANAWVQRGLDLDPQDAVLLQNRRVIEAHLAP